MSAKLIPKAMYIKSKSVILFLLFSASLMILRCEKSEPINTTYTADDQYLEEDSLISDYPPLGLSYLSTILGGCNKNSNKSTTLLSDTVRISVTNDTLEIYIKCYFPCGLEFVTNYEFRDNLLLLYINLDGGGEADCNCYYTFDFVFEEYNYSPFIWRLIYNDTDLWAEGCYQY